MIRVALLGVCLIAAGCTSTYAYKEATSKRGTGYSEQKLEDDRYRVQYRFAKDDVGTAKDFALLRAAELTLEQGFSTFEIVQSSETVTTETINYPPRYAFEVVVLRTDSDAVANVEIIVSNADPDTSHNHYDAAEIQRNLASA